MIDILNDESLSSDSTIDSFNDLKISDNNKDFRSERVNKYGFEPQKEIVYNRYLPYSHQLDEECLQYLSQIKANIGRTLVLNDKHGFQWISDLSKYLRLYGQTFSKEDHIYFINTLYEVIIIPGLELNRVSHYASVLSSLLKKKELISRDDLIIRWRPLYDLFEKTLFSPYENLGMYFIPDNYENSIKNLIRNCRPYFSLDSTKEMLDEWRPLLCPYDTVIIKATSYLELFLPTLLPPEHHEKGFKLWFDEFMLLWQTSQNTPSWEQNLISLFARLANDTIGYIDWNPLIPQIFTHLIRSFNLMGGQHKVQITRGYTVFNINSVVVWLVAMLGPHTNCQKHVTKLFKAVESYYHPSNTGKWNVKLQQLLFKLPASFVSRLHRERYKKHSWRTPIPDNCKLTEEDINQFVNSIVNVVMISMFSRFGSAESATALQSLSLLRPEKVIPPVLEKMYSALETLTEPHRLTASMQCVSSVARALVKGNKYYPEGPTHVIPLLISSLDGLDVNDMKKCMVTFQFIATFATLIPLIDCSAATDVRTDLTEYEVQLCLATAQFEDFVLQLMDRCFVLIENSSLELINRLDQETERLNTEENIIEIGLASTFGSVLLQCSPQILESAIDKLFFFVSSHIFETKVAGKFAAILVRSCSKANAELSLKKFLPHFCKLVLTLTESDDILNEEFLDPELLFGLQIISELVRCDGKHLVKYSDIIIKVLDRTLHLKCRKGYLLSSVILKHVLKSLTILCVHDFKSIPKSWEDYANFEKDLPIRDWGCTVDIHHLNVKWHEPSDEELEFAQHLLETFLKSELQDLQNWTKGEKSFTREEVQRTLLIIVDCITGAASALPLWEGQHIVLYESLIPNNTTIVKSVGAKVINFSNNENIRESVLRTIRSTLVHLNNSCEDDTKSLCRLIKIYNNSMFFWGVTKNDYETRWKGFNVVKKTLGNKLAEKKQHIRALTIDRLVLQHDMRLMNKSMTKFTELHQLLIKDLMLLATSHYSEVRCQAQDTLFNCFRSFPYSYRLTLPDLMKNLSKDHDSNHEQFKGSLYVIIGRRGSSLLTARDWSTLNVLWPTIVNAKNSEKPSIIRLLDVEITGYVRKYFDTLALSVNIPDSCVAIAKTVWTLNKSNPKPAHDCPTDAEISSALKIAQKRNDTNIDFYKDLAEKLVSLMESSNLHWRYYQLSFVLLSMLIRHDIPLPVNAIKLFTKNLIHDTLYIRKISIAAFSAVLKQMKRNHIKSELTPTPTDNLWLQTNSSLVINSEDQFKSMNFIDKPHIGFYCFPEPLLIYGENNSPKNLNNEKPTESELIVFNSFTNTEFLNQFLSYLSLEENKGKDKFSSKRFHLWKALFRNFGPFNLDQLMPKITVFVSETQESAHRCASEIIAGCVRGSKHWNFEDTSKMISHLQPIISQVFNNITTETLGDWGTCSATIFENRDARRLTWILKIFMDDPLKAESEVLSSFLQASRLYLLHGAVQQQEWRSQKVLQELLSYLEDNHLTHSYQNVRERIGSILCNIFMFDVNIPSLPNTFECSPKRSAFIDKIIPRLQILYTQTSDSKDGQKNDTNLLNGLTSQSPERKDAANLLKTMSKWIVGNVPRVAYSAPPDIFKFLPILCQMQSETSDEELVRESFFAIIMLSHALLTPEGIDMAISVSKQVCVTANWHARSAITTFLQYMVSSNLFVLMDNQLWVEDIKQMILALLSDERNEVRESTAETLSGLLHCEFVKIDRKLIKLFESKSNHKLNRIKQSNGTTIVDPKDLTLRHSGILGLCACINAFPYDVPDFMPETLVFLSYHLNDPQPIPTAIKKTLSNFRRTHSDSWRDHKLKFSDDQLAVITDLLVSPNYYA